MNNIRFDTWPDDLFLVSYPKSGNTWLRYLFGHYISGEEYPDVSQLIPDLYVNLDVILKQKQKRLIKSHEPFRDEKQRVFYIVRDGQYLTIPYSKYPRVIYIVRDGRDVAVSYYFYMQSRKLIPLDMPFGDYLRAFNANRIDHIRAFNINQPDQYYSWSDHVHSWLDNASESFLLLRYEDMKADAETQFLRCLEFAHFPIEMDRVNFAVECCKFENLQQREQNWYSQKGNAPLYPFFRKGTSGQWQEYFTEEMLEIFLARHGSALERVGYTDVALDSRKVYGNVRRELERVIGCQDRKYLALKQEVSHLRQQLEQAHAVITEIESSKFWLIRRAWFQLRNCFRKIRQRCG
ncbi:sulfotransferase domain-containing protein [Leptolyngbya sp. FACHB-16]|uniref:sulfotransferase domain-containing protein n=1 Tax=unclassified Leptolyngbya TaxID=2650499 RepID=UPI001682D2EC|nr:sulfotransferase domain-containing protein [Leptolyngbya sp. FACHB-16]MBD2158907.1 sulfotransferase domain-containing protein [Leptolyngbya sp. FACHB-16]